MRKGICGIVVGFSVQQMKMRPSRDISLPVSAVESKIVVQYEKNKI